MIHWLLEWLFACKHVWDMQPVDFRVVDGRKQLRWRYTCKLCLHQPTTDWE